MASLFLVGFAFGAASLSTASSLSAQDAALIGTYFERLREQRLFGLAERYGLDRRAELPVESATSVQLAVELSRTFADHARAAATAEEQAFLQTRAEEALEDYRGDETFPRIEAVRLERAYRTIDRAELAWWTATAEPDDAALRVAASEQLAKARSELERWIETAVLSAARPTESRGPEDLTRRELASLIHASRLKLIDLQLLAAELATTKPETERFVRQAEDGMKRVAGSAERGTTAALRGSTVRIARLLGDEQELKRQVRQSVSDRLPLAVRQNAVAELAQFELERGRYEAAARLLVESKESLGEINDRLRALHAESLLGMSRSAGAQREQLLANAESSLANVAGPWRMKVESLLHEARQVQAYGEQAAALVQKGNREFRAGRRDEAISRSDSELAQGLRPLAQPRHARQPVRPAAWPRRRRPVGRGSAHWPCICPGD